ncbi:MAG TPA: hypothetical protein VFK32_07085, partial [Tepidiformaceae bacterium]|nr:hypothetical protein [Tepidiformaceae bacterium]
DDRTCPSGCVNIFFDEDNGTGIPRALRLLRIPTARIYFPSNEPGALIAKGAKDVERIPRVGREGWLVFSQNRAMLDNERELELLVQHRVGIVFLTNGNQRAHLVMRLLLNRWPWLESVDAGVNRPFAYLLTLYGRVTPVDLTDRLGGLRGG